MGLRRVVGEYCVPASHGVCQAVYFIHDARAGSLHVALRTDVTHTDFVAVEAHDEVQELHVQTIAITHSPEKNPWRAHAPRAAPLQR
jgi:hypothetical protein